MSVEELVVIDGGKCLLQIRGVDEYIKSIAKELGKREYIDDLRKNERIKNLLEGYG